MKRGFTLVEIIIVCAIIAVLVSIGVPGYLGILQHAHATEGITILSAVHKAAMRYLDANNESAQSVGDLDIILPASAKYFCMPPAVNGANAAITYNGSLYTLYATCTYQIKCQESGGHCPQGVTKGDFDYDSQNCTGGVPAPACGFVK